MSKGAEEQTKTDVKVAQQPLLMLSQIWTPLLKPVDLKLRSKPAEIALPLYGSLDMLAISTLEHLGVLMGVGA